MLRHSTLVRVFDSLAPGQVRNSASHSHCLQMQMQTSFINCKQLLIRVDSGSLIGFLLVLH
jgi:hypothetical protein